MVMSSQFPITYPICNLPILILIIIHVFMFPSFIFFYVIYKNETILLHAMNYENTNDENTT